MKKIFLIAAVLFSTFSFALAQEKNEGSNKKVHVEDGDVTITVNGKEMDLEDYLENLGDRIEASVEKARENDKINININDKSIDIDFSFAEAMEAFGETLAEGIEEAVKNMNVQLHDVDPDKLRDSDSQINGVSVAEMVEELENKHGSEIKHIHTLNMKLRDDYMIVEMDYELEDGRRIDNFKKVLD